MKEKLNGCVVCGWPVLGVTLAVTLLAMTVSGQVTTVFQSQVSCNLTASDCSTCIGSGPSCAWCAQDREIPMRCMAIDDWNLAGTCPADIQNPQPAYTILENAELGEQVQIKPQRFWIKLRPGATQTISFQVRPARNYPLDVYYLMDLSASMENDLQTLRNQSSSLADALRDVSTNSRLGFGAFVEKPVEPFSLARGPIVLQPCQRCTAPYSYRNVLPLTQDLDVFRSSLLNLQISANIDEPEDSLTALVQAASCIGPIGWQERARKVVVVASDAGYHIAGEGTLAGIIRPNDGKCHLTNDVEFSEARNMDYPSVGLVKRVLEENRVSTIFAVTQSAKPVYEALSSQLPASNVLLLTSDSSNAVQILREELARQISITNLTVIPHNGGVVITASADCPVGEPEFPHGLPLCRNMTVDATATFTVNFTGTTCAKLDALDKVTLRIQGFDDVIVEVESLCQCPCETEPPVSNSEHCNNAGKEICGGCTCNPGYRSVNGGRCNCNETGGTAPCVNPAGPSDEVCSELGVCECMECNCLQDENNPSKVICGKYCHCHNQMCPTFEGLICGGEERGTCPCSSCGECDCKPGYTGEDCSCPLSEDLCKKEGEQRVCSGEGVCQCGECICKNGYAGRFCDVCPNTGSACASICDRSSVCQSCSNNEDGDCKICNSKVKMNIEPPTDDASYLIDGIQATVCQKDCTSRYFVAQNGEGLLTTIHIDESSDSCPSSLNFVPIILGIIFGMLLLGILALILWKLWARWRDRKEYQDFLKNRNDTIWGKDESPLFEPAVKTYDNPQYAAKKEAEARAQQASEQREATSNF